LAPVNRQFAGSPVPPSVSFHYIPQRHVDG
jgi:hypothetical protein